MLALLTGGGLGDSTGTQFPTSGHGGTRQGAGVDSQTNPWTSFTSSWTKPRHRHLLFFSLSLSLSFSPCRLTGEQRMVEQGSSGGSAKHGSTSSHPNTPGLILQKSSTGTPAPHAKHSAVSARQQNVISQKDSSLHPNTGSSTNPGGQMHPVTHTVGHAMRSPKLSHVVGHGLAQPDHVPPEHSQIS